MYKFSQFSRSVVFDSATPWIAAHQASLSITISRSSLKLTSIKSVMPLKKCSFVIMKVWFLLQCFGHLMRRVDWLIGKDSDAEMDWGQEEKGMKWLDGITDLMDVESEWTPGVGDGQGGLACCDSWGRKASDTTEWLNWTELKYTLIYL